MRIPGYFGSRFIACAGWALLVCAIWIAGAREAKAQSNSDAFFGYSRLGSNLFRSGTPGLNGWEGDLHIHVKPFVGVEGDLAHYGVGASRSTARSTTVLFGPRVTLKAAGFHLFAHAMIGGEHTSSSTTYAYALGGGVDVPIRLMFAWRVQADRISAPTASPSNATHARFTTGLVFRF